MKSPSHSKHQAILDGARQVFLAHGYSGASMEAIARVQKVWAVFALPTQATAFT